MKMILGGTRQLPCPDDGPSYHLYCCHYFVWIGDGKGGTADVGSDHCDCFLTPPSGSTASCTFVA